MSGILKDLQKKSKHRLNTASQLLIQRNSNQQEESDEVRVETISSSLGDKEKLAAEVNSHRRQQTRFPATTRAVKFVKSRQPSQLNVAKKSSLLSSDIPAWVGQLPKSSPHVDQLVPEARYALNDLITEHTTHEELPNLIVKSVNIAAQRLSSGTRFSQSDIEGAISELTGLILGKGPLQPLYDDPAVTDIYLDAHDSIKCVRKGVALETPFRFRSPEEYEAYIASMLQRVERVLNVSSPIVDCVLDDEYRSRVNAIHSSLLDRPESAVVIRVPRLQHITFFDLIQTRTLPPQVAAWLAELMSVGEANVLVVGATGSGKTVFTTALLSAVGSDERICTIEDVPEIFVPTAHLEKLVSRPENAQGKGAVEMHQLLRAALRRAPHRIVVGEIRDKEGPLFLKALETGHRGSVATIHARSSKEGLWRLLDVVAAYENSPEHSIQRRISRSVNIVICMERIDGAPCMVDISEVRPPVEGEFIVTQLVRFEFEDEEKKRYWRITSRHSEWVERLAQRGIELIPGDYLLPHDPTSEH
ncbi:MAG: CpaF family protein [Candidatus Dadabacteria bacterium]|nr:MAG: CpaF family protein [Candidatus Dadabacteria bacterium]